MEAKKLNFKETLHNELLTFDITVSDLHLELFEKYYTLLVSWNEKVNLTSIIEPLDVIRKHFLDSLLLVKDLDFSKVNNLIDIGSGAGFPGLPLKIVYPHLEITLLDSLNKRCVFLEEVAQELALDKVTVIHDRAEMLARHKEYREKFDIATARAVASLSIITEYCLPFVKVGGYFIAPKGKDGEIELGRAKNAILLVGGEVEKINLYELPDDIGQRYNILIKKVSITLPKYPRRAGLPEKKPL